MTREQLMLALQLGHRKCVQASGTIPHHCSVSHGGFETLMGMDQFSYDRPATRTARINGVSLWVTREMSDQHIVAVAADGKSYRVDRDCKTLDDIPASNYRIPIRTLQQFQANESYLLSRYPTSKLSEALTIEK